LKSVRNLDNRSAIPVPEPHAGHWPQPDAANLARRAELFREPPGAMLRRWMLGTLYALKPARVFGLPALARLWLADLVAPDRSLPDPQTGLANPSGLCGIVHDMSVPTLIEAYRRGLYPWAHISPLKWLSPPERCVLSFERFHISRRLRSRLRQQRYVVTFDRDFDGVIAACAKPREGKWPLTWITPQIMHAYAALHDAGYAHSFEVTNRAGELVGGGYGVAVGGAFVIESQFSRESGSSKIGFAMLAWHLARWGYTLADNKGPTQNVLEMGFCTIPRAHFLARLAAAQRLPDRAGRWQVETDLDTIAAWRPDAAHAEATLVPATSDAVAQPLRMIAT
jgi:leucyl/phenylalanyl-tRNA--protein transferase